MCNLRQVSYKMIVRLEKAFATAGEAGRAEFLRRRMQRPRLADMAEDFGVLAAELERCFGEEGTAPEPLQAPGGTRIISSRLDDVSRGGIMPTRAQLRATARTDLEKAIAAHGGPAAVAKRMGWRLAYKVRSFVRCAVCSVGLSHRCVQCGWWGALCE